MCRSNDGFLFCRTHRSRRASGEQPFSYPVPSEQIVRQLEILSGAMPSPLQVSSTPFSLQPINTAPFLAREEASMHTTESMEKFFVRLACEGSGSMPF
jgi:hypothetical protein